MTLLTSQQVFAAAVPKLINKALSMGYSVTLGDAYRDPRVHGVFGVKASYAAAESEHKRRLAIDINLFKDGRFLSSSADHEPLGRYWESIGGIWGGYNDGNHYQWPLT